MTAALLILALLLNDLEIGILILGLASLFFFSNVWGLPEKIDIKLERDIIPDETFGVEDIRLESPLRNLTGTTFRNVDVQENIDDIIITEKDSKRINWKASSRYNELIVNETEAERVTDVMIVLDTDVTFFGPTESELFERGIQAAASMTRLLLRQGNRVGLVLQGGERG